MTRFGRVARLTVALMTAAPVVAADAGVPARIRILRGSRQGPPAVAPGLHDLAHQLSQVSYVRWDQAGETQVTMEFRKPVTLQLPGGESVAVTLVESRGATVTFEVLSPSSRTHSRITVQKDKRVVHQVTQERGGEAYFVTIRPWP